MGGVITGYSVSNIRFLRYIILIPEDEALSNEFGSVPNTRQPVEEPNIETTRWRLSSEETWNVRAAVIGD
jgi:hypothetical protein